jgi:threonine dehydrogenase-like Zn-dependent dehydrogenase
MSEFFTHPANMLYPAPPDMPWELIPLAEPLTIALHGLHRLKAASGEHVAIFGAGPIGLLAAMCTLHYGAVPILIDVVSQRLDAARALGVRETIHLAAVSGPNGLESRVREITGGRMCECVFEASGAGAAIRSSLDIASHAGRIALIGWPKDDTALPTDVITRKELDVRGARNSANEFAEALELIASGRADVRAILTKTVPLEDAARALMDIERRPGDFLKVNVVLP